MLWFYLWCYPQITILLTCQSCVLITFAGRLIRLQNINTRIRNMMSTTIPPRKKNTPGLWREGLGDFSTVSGSQDFIIIRTFNLRTWKIWENSKNPFIHPISNALIFTIIKRIIWNIFSQACIVRLNHVILTNLHYFFFRKLKKCDYMSCGD